jgi:hypothetical protein
MVDERIFRGDVHAPRNDGATAGGTFRVGPDGDGVVYRGRAVSARVHLEAVPPVLLEAYGEEWFRRGTLSMWFRAPTFDGEATQVVAHRWPDRPLLSLRIERPSGEVVAVGTAALGEPDEASELELRFLRAGPGRPVRLLAAVEPGDRLPRVTARLDGAAQLERVADGAVVAPLPWYSGGSPWGGPIATPYTEVSALGHLPTGPLRAAVPPCVAVYQGVELRHVTGPLVLGRTYRFGGRIIEVGADGEAELVWFRTWADDEAGRRVAELTVLARLTPDPDAAPADDTGRAGVAGEGGPAG